MSSAVRPQRPVVSTVRQEERREFYCACQAAARLKLRIDSPYSAFGTIDVLLSLSGVSRKPCLSVGGDAEECWLPLVTKTIMRLSHQIIS